MARNPADMHFRRQDFDHSEEMLETFKNIFGLHEFRVNQLEAINATILGENVFVVGGNGAGKSLCYQLPACLSAGVTVVISPLKSLILDQIQKLTQLGIKARTVSGGQGYTDEESIYQQLSEMDPIIKLLYVTPEKLTNRKLIKALQDLLDRDLLARFAIDEAQCICQWGNNFRLDYGTLNELQQDFPGVPMIALSGPFGPNRVHIQEDIIKQLKMTDPQVFTMSNIRTNLKYAVRTRPAIYGEPNFGDCINWIKEHYPRDSGIVYCWTHKHCKSIAKSLIKEGLVACSYHSKMSDEDKERVQNKWNENECQVICATVAFSMGIHKPDVRYVIHSFLPKSMENYYRESGRAGRDGKMSHCILFYAINDKDQISFAISNDKNMTKKSIVRESGNLKRMEKYCQNTKECRRKQLLTYFGGVDIEANKCLPNSEAICDNCKIANKEKVMSRRRKKKLHDRPTLSLKRKWSYEFPGRR